MSKLTRVQLAVVKFAAEGVVAGALKLSTAQLTALEFAALPMGGRAGRRSGIATRRNAVGQASAATWTALLRRGLVSGPPWKATDAGLVALAAHRSGASS